jgi:GNAT superfamily N-acetyltransferase
MWDSEWWKRLWEKEQRQAITEDGIREAFTPPYQNIVCEMEIRHNEERDTWSVHVEAKDRNADMATVATYQRELEPRLGRAEHTIIRVEDGYQDSGFARSLLAKSLEFYQRVGIHEVTLVAEKTGLCIWPRYGWSPDEGSGLPILHQEMRRLYTEDTGRPFPENWDLPRYGPHIIDYITPGAEKFPGEALLGVRALESLRDRGIGLPMTLNLRNEKTLERLHVKGLLGVERSQELEIIERKSQNMERRAAYEKAFLEEPPQLHSPEGPKIGF